MKVGCIWPWLMTRSHANWLANVTLDHKRCCPECAYDRRVETKSSKTGVSSF